MFLLVFNVSSQYSYRVSFGFSYYWTAIRIFIYMLICFHIPQSKMPLSLYSYISTSLNPHSHIYSCSPHFIFSQIRGSKPSNERRIQVKTVIRLRSSFFEAKIVFDLDVCPVWQGLINQAPLATRIWIFSTFSRCF